MKKFTYEVSVEVDDEMNDEMEIVFAHRIFNTISPILTFDGTKDIHVTCIKPENFNIKEKLHYNFWKLTVRSFLNINGKREVFERQCIFYSRDIALKAAKDYSKSDTTLMAALTAHTYFYQGMFTEHKKEIPITTDDEIVFLYKKHGLKEDGEE